MSFLQLGIALPLTFDLFQNAHSTASLRGDETAFTVAAIQFAANDTRDGYAFRVFMTQIYDPSFSPIGI
jgi:hypothetical protein